MIKIQHVREEVKKKELDDSIVIYEKIQEKLEETNEKQKQQISQTVQKLRELSEQEEKYINQSK